MTEFTEEEKALYGRCPKKVQQFIQLHWKNAASYDDWRHVRASVHGARIYENGKKSELLEAWYRLAQKRMEAL